MCNDHGRGTLRESIMCIQFSMPALICVPDEFLLPEYSAGRCLKSTECQTWVIDRDPYACHSYWWRSWVSFKPFFNSVCDSLWWHWGLTSKRGIRMNWSTAQGCHSDMVHFSWRTDGYVSDEQTMQEETLLGYWMPIINRRRKHWWNVGIPFLLFSHSHYVLSVFKISFISNYINPEAVGLIAFTDLSTVAIRTVLTAIASYLNAVVLVLGMH